MGADRKRLILHVGMPKTGTTSIQNVLRANEGALRRAGLMYPGPADDPLLAGTPKHRAYLTALAGRSVGKPGAADLAACRASLDGVVRRFAEDGGLASLVISHELLALSHEALAGSAAAEWQDAFDLSAVLYVRPLREWAQARYVQGVWAQARGLGGPGGGRIATFAQSVMARLDQTLPSRIHAGLSASLPRAKVELRSYSLGRATGTLVEDFVASALADPGRLEGPLDTGGGFVNRSRPLVVVMLVHGLMQAGAPADAVRVIAEAAAAASIRKGGAGLPLDDEDFSFVSDDEFARLETLDREQAALFPGLGLDAPVARHPGAKTGFDAGDLSAMLEWVRPHIPEKDFVRAVEWQKNAA